MGNYKNYSGKSNIDSFEINPDSIHVVFKSGRERHYLYTYRTPGEYHVEKMKELALSGQGLNSYINRIVKSNFQDKW